MNIQRSIFLFFLSFIGTLMFADNTICSDEIFIRRATIASTGRLPQSVRVKEFLASKDRDKREQLIDELLDSEAYVDYITMRWGDILRIKSEFPSNLWPNGVQAYNRWIRNYIANNSSYDVFVKDLLLSKGSNYKMPAVNFYRAFPLRNSEMYFKNINLLFLGSREYDKEGHKFFSQIKFKSTKEWKEEIIFLEYNTSLKSQKIHLPNGKTVILEPDKDWRIDYVEWLVSKENRRFAEVMVNRVYSWLLGKGIVNEPDNWSENNLPSNPVLLENLTNEFIASGFDLKNLFSVILSSANFQNAINFEPYRLHAEVLVDALADVTGNSDSYRSRVPEPFTFYPEGTRSINLGDASVSSPTLELFGRPSRDVSLENQRNTTLTDRQVLYLLNSSDLERKIRKSPQIIRILESTKTINELCNEISLMALSRFPTKEEIQIYKSYSEKNKLTRRDFACDLLWMIINSNEFLYQH